jgi:hypothetical protein
MGTNEQAEYNTSDYHKIELAKSLFPDSKKDQESASWSDILDEVQIIKEHLVSVEGVFDQIEKDNSVNKSLIGEYPEDAADIIRDRLNEYQEQCEELTDRVQELEDSQEEAISDQQVATLELLSDLGFDTSQLLFNDKLDPSNPNVLYNLKKQLNRMTSR